jgi:hypothetical protein
MSISRRESLALASASIAAASIPIIGARAALTDVPTADVKPLDYKLEKGAELRVLRPAKFIDPDEVFWRENTKKYTDATGIPSASTSSVGRTFVLRPPWWQTPAPDRTSLSASAPTHRSTPPKSLT